ncbi:MAG: class 1 fructose-bisphosphatase [Bacteroidales bacterium]|nr:class 1 fructose-bisphosphatase [Bacteroidales bacterium]
MKKLITLTEFIIDRQGEIPDASGDLTRILNDIGIATKFVHREVNKAGLADILGLEGTENVQGEQQKKLDVYANNQFISALKAGGQCAAIASEENEEVIILDNPISNNAKYVVAIDPLDGSSNIEANVSIGTVFSIYKRKSPIGKPAEETDLLQPGTDLVAAGYAIYGSSTMLVYTTGHGVNGFTLDPSVGLFILSHPNIHYPEHGSIYSVNESNRIYFPEGIKAYIQFCHEDDPATKRPYITRYIGSMVADVHRNILLGGIFLYPGTVKKPQGKLRLLYECKPMAFIAEQAGGKASDGSRRILEIHPDSVHQRSPFFMGPSQMVDKIEEFIRFF